MTFIRRIFRKFFPKYIQDEELDQENLLRYQRIWAYVVVLTSLVALTPLVFVTILTINQYRHAFENEVRYPVRNLVSNAKRSIEFTLEEHRAALTFIINDKSFEELSDQDNLSNTFFHLKNVMSGFVDIGLIDSDGTQRSYVGPYELLGRNYRNQDWFNEIRLRHLFISDVFMGFRQFPHFVIAVKHQRNGGDFYILRATVNTDFFIREISSLPLRQTSDAFLINKDGTLQTSSRFFGNILEECKLETPMFSTKEEIVDSQDENGDRFLLGYAFVEESPFIFMVVERPEELMKNWYVLRRELLGFVVISVGVIVLVVLWGATYMIDKIREADKKRAKIIHNLEYTNKMASIGRLAAGVAHEINNPLAIINQKAGLMEDIVESLEQVPYKDKFMDIVSSILKSVERCSAITHRFLGFAKRLELKKEPINLQALLNEVLGFLGKEAEFRDITIKFHIDDFVPDIESDRGQLQQVFLNIVNNAFAASSDGAKIDIYIKDNKDDTIAVTISDNGQGISEEHLEHIFEPFYTTKKEGTGLGLSITYGIVEKLGGSIIVKSKLGVGTSFTITLPVNDENFK